jgi:hypothetical protein
MVVQVNHLVSLAHLYFMPEVAAGELMRVEQVELEVLRLEETDLVLLMLLVEMELQIVEPVAAVVLGVAALQVLQLPAVMGVQVLL